MESIGNQATQISTLYRPAPATALQSNLAQYYEKTSSFVGEKFKDLVDVPGNENDRRPQKSSSDTEKPRLNPAGVGSRLDIYA
ncbi:MAG: hypothetical protein RBU29_05755 [bacterium]|jgi:hypothetical protein|nr:hypothetical protein [bacterium]